MEYLLLMKGTMWHGHEITQIRPSLVLLPKRHIVLLWLYVIFHPLDFTAYSKINSTDMN